MKKVIFKTSNLFSMKKYNQADTLCQSYEYPTIYGVRCAIIGAIIQIEGVEKAEELFHKIKNSNIYIQYPKVFYKTAVKQSRLKEGRSANTFITTMGVREYLNLDEIVLYIDDMIPDINTYLKNIDWLGNAESMIYLDGIAEVDKLENVLVKSAFLEEVKVYEQHDWSSKTKFEDVYAYKKKYKHIHETFMCKIDDIEL